MKKINFKLAIILTALILSVSSCKKNEYCGEWHGDINYSECFNLIIEKDGHFRLEMYNKRDDPKFHGIHYSGTWEDCPDQPLIMGLLLEPETERQYSSSGGSLIKSKNNPAHSALEYLGFILNEITPEGATLKAIKTNGSSWYAKCALKKSE
ncbi:MAG: hypothetical protein K2M00_05600 [Muribaculaceae bacterium]|nr:hypothetical protein [Muribaculaceae bacterium]